MPYQYGNEANPRAHYEGTAVEILDELDEVTAFVAGLGTGGTLMGNGRRLKEENPATEIVAAEPMQGELVQGLRSLDDGFIPPIIDLTLLDRKIFVSNRDAVVWTKKLLAEEGLFVGVSSGAIAAIAVRVANEIDEGNVVFIVADDGWKYLSSASTRSRSRSSRRPREGRLLVGVASCGVAASRGRPSSAIASRRVIALIGSAPPSCADADSRCRQGGVGRRSRAERRRRAMIGRSELRGPPATRPRAALASRRAYAALEGARQRDPARQLPQHDELRPPCPWRPRSRGAGGPRAPHCE